MKTILLILAVSSCFIIQKLSATPIYQGNTFASNISSAQMHSGYYLWHDDELATSWHLRWTSTNQVSNSPVYWFGRIIFQGMSFTNNAGAYDLAAPYYDSNNHSSSDLDYLLEVNDHISVSQNAPNSPNDEIIWDTRTNDSGGIDGLDFTLDGPLQTITIELGSSLFTNTVTNAANNAASEYIFIGNNFDTPDVSVFQQDQQNYQSFVIISTPSSIALLSLALTIILLIQVVHKKHYSSSA